MSRDRKTRLSYKQRAFLNSLVASNGDPGVAFKNLLDTGMYKSDIELSRTDLVNRGQKIIDRIQKHNEVKDILNQVGLNLTSWAIGMKELTKATKPIISKGKITGEQADHIARFNSLKIVGEALGITKSKSDVNIMQDQRQQSIIVHVTPPEGLPALREQELQQQREYLKELGIEDAKVEEQINRCEKWTDEHNDKS